MLDFILDHYEFMNHGFIMAFMFVLISKVFLSGIVKIVFLSWEQSSLDCLGHVPEDCVELG